MICTRCDGTGFLNSGGIPEKILTCGDVDTILRWLRTPEGEASDAQICDCCGSGENWYGEAGRHYGADDPGGERGPYAYNGGFAECH